MISSFGQSCENKTNTFNNKLTDLVILRLNLCSARLTVLDLALNVNQTDNQTTLASYRRLQTLDNTLSAATEFISLLSSTPLSAAPGTNVDLFTQLTHCLIVLFKLTVIKEPGWNTQDVIQRADIFAIIDRKCEMIENVPIAVGMVDAPGPRKGLFFKTGLLLQKIKKLFEEEMARLNGGAVEAGSSKETGYPSVSTDFSMDDGSLGGEFLLNMENEAWIAGLWDHSWYIPPDYLPDSQFQGYQ
jgi:hypothetical protein